MSNSSALVTILVIATVAGACALPISQRFEIEAPQGTWIVLEIDNPDCPDAYTDTLRIPPSGYSCVRNSPDDEWTRTIYYVVTENGDLERIPRRLVHRNALIKVELADNREVKALVFWYGNKADIKEGPASSLRALSRSQPASR